MVKEGDRFKDGTTGKIFRVKKHSEDTIVLEIEDEIGQAVMILDKLESPQLTTDDREG